MSTTFAYQPTHPQGFAHHYHYPPHVHHSAAMPSHQPSYCDSGLGQAGPVVHHPTPHHYQPKHQQQQQAESPCTDLLPLQGHPTPYAQYAELPLVDDYGFYYEPLTTTPAIPIPQSNRQSTPSALGLNNSLGLSNVPAPDVDSPITVDLQAFTDYEANLHSYHHDMLNAWLDRPETAREHTSPPPPPTPTMAYLELDDDSDEDLDIVSGGVRLLAL